MIKKHFINSLTDIRDISLVIQKFYATNQNVAIIITGPTNAGKTALAHNLYKEFDSRLISADSRQIYQLLNIGSNKPVIKNHYILDGFYTSVAIDNNYQYDYWNLDYLPLSRNFSAQNYRDVTRQMIFLLNAQKKLPIIVGGTFHWLRSLTHIRKSPYINSDNQMYLNLCNMSVLDLQKLYRQYYPDYRINISDWQNKRRLARAIEYFMATQKSIYQQTKTVFDDINFLILQYLIDRDIHKEKIKQSVTKRIENGWINETEGILQLYGESVFDKIGQGYRIIKNYLLDGKKIDIKKLIEEITIAEMRYAKKQNF